MPDLGWTRYERGQEQAAMGEFLEEFRHDLIHFAYEFPQHGRQAADLREQVEALLEAGGVDVATLEVRPTEETA
jgi:hypothetical protein